MQGIAKTLYYLSIDMDYLDYSENYEEEMSRLITDLDNIKNKAPYLMAALQSLSDNFREEVEQVL